MVDQAIAADPDAWAKFCAGEGCSEDSSESSLAGRGVRRVQYDLRSSMAA